MIKGEKTMTKEFLKDELLSNVMLTQRVIYVIEELLGHLDDLPQALYQVVNDYTDEDEARVLYVVDAINNSARDLESVKGALPCLCENALEQTLYK